MSRIAALLLMMALLAGCATSPTPATPRELAFAVPPETALIASAEVLMDNGYVVRHADAELGRLEAVLARWPGYRVQVRVAGQAAGSLVSLTAFRGGRPLPPQTLDRLLVALQDHLGLLP